MHPSINFACKGGVKHIAVLLTFGLGLENLIIAAGLFTPSSPSNDGSKLGGQFI